MEENTLIKSNNGVIRLDNFEQAEEYLTSMLNYDYNNINIKEVIKCQIGVLKYAQSTDISTSFIDTLLLNLQKNLTPENREAFILLLHNYLFFLKAKLELEFRKKDKEAIALFEQAGQDLSKAIAETVLLATTSSIGSPQVAQVVVENFFKTDEEGLLTRILKFFLKKRFLSKKEREYYVFLNKLFDKLYRNRAIIGESLIITELIEDNIERVTEIVIDNKKIIQGLKKQLDEDISNAIEVVLSTIGICFGLGLLSVILRWLWIKIPLLWGAISNTNPNWATNQWYIIGIVSLCITFTMLIIMVFTILRTKFKINSEFKRIRNLKKKFKMYAEYFSPKI